MANIQLFRRQKTFQDEEEKFYKKQQWLREKEVEDAHRNAFEKERREILAKKRDQEREDFYRRLEEAQKKLLVAQNNLEQVLQKHHQEKRVTFKESSWSKVRCNCITYYLQSADADCQLQPSSDVRDLAEKSRKVEAALEEIQHREEELRKHRDREETVLRRKEEMEQKIKERILSANR